MIRKLLVANRGEIAIRIFRAAKSMGIPTVAVFSEADERQAHVEFADEAVFIGDSEPSKSYLNMDAILEACQKTGANAVHPGYGFLSERAEFAEACVANEIIFIGPSAASMRALGSKIDAKNLAVSCNVPIAPGFFEPGATLEQLERAAQEIGYPILLKASAGGGGRGMRIVRDPADFAEEFQIASDEALKGFGDGAMMVEKLIEKPRHIEAQLHADHHGNIAVLFERECSIQRRHQKLIEEAPSPLFARDEFAHIWPKMREACVQLVKASGYSNAGTVEFMLDEASGDFYFLEVNARLQVEHPVTEQITGLDLAQWQLRIANGEALDLPENLMAGNRSAISGHSIEVRIVAEDPGANFMPSIGKILAWAEPKASMVRVDTGYRQGAEISRFYDSLAAKVIAHGETRLQAIQKLEIALRDFHILGVKTNIGYLLDVLAHPDFRAGNIDTGFLAREMGDWSPPAPPAELGSLVELAIGVSATSQSNSPDENSKPAWGTSDGFRNVRP